MKTTIVSAKEGVLKELSGFISRKTSSLDIYPVLSQNISSEILQGSSIIVNLISGEEANLNVKSAYPADLKKAALTKDTVKCFGIKNDLDRFAGAVKLTGGEAVIINAGEPADLITLYLYKEHKIMSYGISAKSENLLKTLIDDTGLHEYEGRLTVRMCGIKDNLWLTELTDEKGKDIYPLAREKAKGLDLHVTRNDLTRDGIRSMKFYGYYHSANVPEKEITECVYDALKNLLSAKESVIYFLTANGGKIDGLDDEMCVETPFKVSKHEIKPVPCRLPMQCILALNDYAGALILAAKVLSTKSKTLFKRTVKIDPYLASILALDELEALSEEIISLNGRQLEGLA